MPPTDSAPRPTLERIARPSLPPAAPDELAPTLPGADPQDVEYEIPVEGDELGQLGPYLVQGWLGAGAMADVYQAEHRVLGHRVAIKVLHKEFTQQEAFLRRFITEGKALTRVQHPNVVRVIDIGRREEDGLTWLAMEFLEGSDLEELCERVRPTAHQAIRLMHQLTKAVAAAHEAGVVHRDIKPSNVFLARTRGKHKVKLVDFGIAKLADDDVLKERDLRGSVIGSPPYLAPEQAQGAETDHRCDIYALGALLFELLVGETPFGGSSVEEMLAAAVAAPPPAPSDHVELPVSVRHALDELVVCCLAKDPAHRPSSAAEVDRHLSWIAQRLEDEPMATSAAAVPQESTRQRAAGDSPTIWANLNPADDDPNG